MCNCDECNESIECIDQHRLVDCSKRIFKLFCGDVYIGIYDSDYEAVWESGSTSKFLSENNQKMSEIKKTILNLEQGIECNNASFDLACNSDITSLVFHKEAGFRIIILNTNKLGVNNNRNINDTLYNIILEIAGIILSS